MVNVKRKINANVNLYLHFIIFLEIDRKYEEVGSVYINVLFYVYMPSLLYLYASNFSCPSTHESVSLC